MLENNIRDELNKAASLGAAGNLQEAIRIAKEIVKEFPQNFNAQMVLAISYSRAREYSNALPFLLQLHQKEPKNPTTLHYLAVAYWQLQNPGVALKFMLEAIHEEAKQAEFYHTLGNIQMSLQDANAAERSAEECLKLNPDLLIAYQLLGQALHRLGKEEEAIKAYEKALAGNADTVATKVLLASVYKSINEPIKVKELLDSIKDSISESDEDQKMEFGQALYRMRFTSEAKAIFEEVYSRNPNNANAARNIAICLRAEGDFKRCTEVCHAAIELEPDSPRTYFEYINSKKVDTDDFWVLKKLLQFSNRTFSNPHEKALVHYSLGKYYSDLQSYENAAENFIAANEAMMGTIDRKFFDLANFRKVNDYAINIFTPEFITQHKVLGSSSSKPIFVLGMIRSGTTLIEQIISSHSQVTSGGEIDYLSNNTGSSFYTNGDFNEEGFKRLQRNYLRLIDSVLPHAPRVTDKMPNNCMILGLIYLLYPHAKIIHTVRNPGDVCLSIYTTPYFNAVPYAHNRQTTVGYYSEYKRIMEHWKSVIPKAYILDVKYEDLVANQEAETRRILEFCDLKWEDECLNYTENGKVILTPSTWQARQPIYSSSIGRWKNYARWFPEFARISEES